MGVSPAAVEVPVYTPVDSYLIDYDYYYGFWGGAIYTFKFQVSCEVAYYFDHLSAVSDRIGAFTPAAPTGDSQPTTLSPPLFFEAGELIGYIGTSQESRTWDFAVLNTGRWNDLPAVPHVYSPNADRYRFAVCPYEYFEESIKAEYIALLGEQGCGP